MEIFSEFDKIINGSLLLDMHYWASSVRMDLFARSGFPSPFDHRDAMATRSYGTLNSQRFHLEVRWGFGIICLTTT